MRAPPLSARLFPHHGTEVCMKTVTRATWFAVLAVGCSTGSTLSEPERAGIAASIEHVVDSFQEAQRRLDADEAIAHLAPSFYMYADGVRQDYQTTAEQIRATMPTLRHFETEWSNVEIMVLGRDAAAVSLVFRDSIVDASGATTILRGVSTLIWRRTPSEWQIVYGDADHYPVTGGADPT